MNHARPILTGLLAAFISSLLLLGGLSQSLAEGVQRGPNPVVPTGTSTPNPERQVTVLSGSGASSTPTGVIQVTATPNRANTATLLPHRITCVPPEGWVAHIVQADETLESLAQAHHISESALATSNCLVTNELLPGTTLNVPANTPIAPNDTATPTPPVVACGPPAGWVEYSVKREDNLYRISVTHGTTVAELQFANCMGTSIIIHVGDRLFVPRVAGQTPSPTSSSAPAQEKPTATAVNDTQTPTPATAAPTDTETPTPTSTAINDIPQAPTPDPSPTPGQTASF